MPDPNVLYIVTTVVALALFAWVAVVLLRPANHRPKAETQKSRAGTSDAVDIDKGTAPKEEPG